ncbi:MAG: AMP-binding protein, partial [Phycisphaerales bacterium]|nr:AMP-binding protein [Phycisphaerales bacterium]
MIRESHSLHSRFEAQVAEAPHASALTFAGESISYAEVNSRANQLARYLRRCGAETGQRVGLCLNRTMDPVIAILAVLKTGAAYVPMDPVYPADRVRLIVEDAQCPIVLVHGEHQDRYAEGGAQVIVLDGASRPWEQEGTDNLDVPVSPADLAYVIYTSGSTGKPKGALVTHWNVYRLFEEMQPDFGFRSDDVWTFFHSYAFDFSVSEMWGALFFGGRIVMVPHLLSRTPEDFYQLLIDEG